MLTVRDLINDPSDTDAGKLSAISDKLWIINLNKNLNRRI